MFRLSKQRIWLPEKMQQDKTKNDQYVHCTVGEICSLGQIAQIVVSHKYNATLIYFLFYCLKFDELYNQIPLFLGLSCLDGI